MADNRVIIYSNSTGKEVTIIYGPVNGALADDAASALRREFAQGKTKNVEVLRPRTSFRNMVTAVTCNEEDFDDVVKRAREVIRPFQRWRRFLATYDVPYVGRMRLSPGQYNAPDARRLASTSQPPTPPPSPFFVIVT